MRTLRYPITGTIDTTVRTRARAALATMFLMMGMFLTMGAFLTMGTGVALADILNVPSQYATIQAAIDAAQAGDQILVEPGRSYLLGTRRARARQGRKLTSLRAGKLRR